MTIFFRSLISFRSFLVVNIRSLLAPGMGPLKKVETNTQILSLTSNLLKHMRLEKEKSDL